VQSLIKAFSSSSSSRFKLLKHVIIQRMLCCVVLNVVTSSWRCYPFSANRAAAVVCCISWSVNVACGWWWCDGLFAGHNTESERRRLLYCCSHHARRNDPQARSVGSTCCIVTVCVCVCAVPYAVPRCLYMPLLCLRVSTSVIAKVINYNRYFGLFVEITHCMAIIHVK